MASSGRPPTSSKLAASQLALTSYLRRQHNQAPTISQKRALSSFIPPVSTIVSKENESNKSTSSCAMSSSTIAYSTTTDTLLRNSLDSDDKKTPHHVQNLFQRLDEYEQAGWISEKDYSIYCKILKESLHSPDAVLFREQVENDLNAAISKNAIIVQPTYVLHSPREAIATTSIEVNTKTEKRHFRRSSTSDVRTRTVTTDDNKQQEVIILEDFDDSVSEPIEDIRRRSTGETLHRSQATDDNLFRNSTQRHSNGMSKPQSILLRNNSFSETTLRSTSQHHVTWSDSPCGESETSSGRSRTTGATEDWNAMSISSSSYASFQKENETYRRFYDKKVEQLSDAKTPLRSNVKPSMTEGPSSSSPSLLVEPSDISSSGKALVSPTSIVELFQIQEYQSQAHSNPRQLELYRWFGDTSNIQNLFVEMCFFARLGFVQPPSCLQCTYKESLTEKLQRTHESTSINTSCPNSNCQRWVVWRKDAFSDTTSNLSNADSIDSPRSTTTMLRPDTLEANIIFIRCHAVRSLLEGKTVEGRQWDKSKKCLLVTNSTMEVTNIGTSHLTRSW